MYDTAIYHTQQCAEKALKAFLVFNNQEITKVHDLKILLQKSISYNPKFTELTDAAIFLTPFATVFRYPNEIMLPDEKDVLLAIEKAEVILNFIKLYLV